MTDKTPLDQIEHIVVLMLENRSFDHMLGYLGLDDDYVDTHGPIEGLRPGLMNVYNNVEYPVYPLLETSMNRHDDPKHSGPHVDLQVSNEMGGFVDDFVNSVDASRREDVLVPDQCVVMGYYTGDQLPALDHLARNYTVCDHWYSSVLGATWPNRLYAMTGTSQGKRSNKKVHGKDYPVYSYPSIARHLDKARLRWRWYRPYSVIPATIQLVEETYRFGGPHMYLYDQFFDDARSGQFPAVSWIDPSFSNKVGMKRNDDHPPMDIVAGQRLIKAMVDAVMASPAWPRTLMVITYDEHGGFYDHVEPPVAEDDHPNTSRFGVRVPTVLVSPFAPPGVCDVQFDHTSILKTILERFCPDSDPAEMGLRVASANSLAGTLVDTSPDERLARPIPSGPRMALVDVEEAVQMGEPAELATLIAQSSDGFDLLRRIQEQSAIGPAILEGGPQQFDDLEEGVLIAVGEIAAINRAQTS